MSDKTDNDDSEPKPPMFTSGEALRHQSKYLSLYEKLLRENHGLFSEQRDEDVSDFTDEATLLKAVISSQRQLWIAGIGIGLLTFVTLHYAPTFLVRRLGGEAKLKALEEAERQAKADGIAFLRKATGEV